MADNSNTNPSTDASGNTVTDKTMGAAKFFTGAIGNTIGGVSRTAGNITGAATKGLGDTITNVTGETGKPLGNAIGSLGAGVNNGMGGLAKGVENAGQWKSPVASDTTDTKVTKQ
ncbi:hypothetical protein VHEMI03562 [[Torrubiella] hemipterigena]|uniref:Uncharacterized protein n=1 Tax=[Torrubiella] hemipterigena TaxID=1531966 RepID=A0A0A1TB63_9HYPO|nr:hypothetical protein VHEMI03562 [[Torrubiella] hemipterigena]